MVKKAVSALALILLMMLVQRANAQPYNSVGFHQSTSFNYETYGDYVPDVPLAWNYTYGYYDFVNYGDDTHEAFDAPYMNLTTTSVFDSFTPWFNETGLSPGGTPYYVWNYSKVSVSDSNRWTISGYSPAASSPGSAPGFSLRRVYSPKALTAQTSRLVVLASLTVDREIGYLTIGANWWESYEASPMLMGAVLKPMFQVAFTEKLVTSGDAGNFGTVFWGMENPPLGVYLVGLVFRVTNKVFPMPIKYLPQIFCSSSSSMSSYLGYLDKVMFTALDGSVITVAGKQSYAWYLSTGLYESVQLLQVSRTV